MNIHYTVKQFSKSGSCDFELNQTKIKGGCQSGRKAVTHNSKSDLPLRKSVTGPKTVKNPHCAMTLLSVKAMKQ